MYIGTEDGHGVLHPPVADRAPEDEEARAAAAAAEPAPPAGGARSARKKRYRTSPTEDDYQRDQVHLRPADLASVTAEIKGLVFPAGMEPPRPPFVDGIKLRYDQMAGAGPGSCYQGPVDNYSMLNPVFVYWIHVATYWFPVAVCQVGLTC